MGMNNKSPWTKPHYGSHVPVLLQALDKSPGPVLELGAGDWSTPVLHQACAYSDTDLLTVESSELWLTRFLPLASERHELVSYEIADERNYIVEESRWGVIFIDHDADRRVNDLLRVDREALIVVHDSEPNHEVVYPGLQAALSEFRYRLDVTTIYPHTTLVTDSPHVRL